MNFSEAEHLIKTRELGEMTASELEVVTSATKDALFEAQAREPLHIFDERRKAMGRWALEVIKNPEVSVVMRHRIREDHKKNMEYFLNHDRPVEIPEFIVKMVDYLNDIEYELIMREIIEIQA